MIYKIRYVVLQKQGLRSSLKYLLMIEFYQLYLKRDRLPVSDLKDCPSTMGKSQECCFSWQVQGEDGGVCERDQKPEHERMANTVNWKPYRMCNDKPETSGVLNIPKWLISRHWLQSLLKRNIFIYIPISIENYIECAITSPRPVASLKSKFKH